MRTVEERINELESIVTHHQQLIADLNEVIIDLHKRLDSLPRDIARLSDEIRVTRELTTQIRRPEDDIPPHY